MYGTIHVFPSFSLSVVVVVSVILSYRDDNLEPAWRVVGSGLMLFRRRFFVQTGSCAGGLGRRGGRVCGASFVDGEVPGRKDAQCPP